ncbi:RNA polymerase sigma factor [Aequorivita marina]|uniref:RNA polymerase sigma factor n=1 Tax=Aequorivita marina TaxID=3073654 RepID=UPI0028751C33|nr:sigma-70 family RNA polymerase sigma factor [Aequorivita sp. S2608]MDS1297503.1 sigma-70 family RNA polymerase sigma factor [Aequorivita sp. S2608]
MLKNNDIEENNSSFNKTTVLIKQNDADTLRELYVINFIKVKHYVLKNNGTEDQAKDVYQEAFIAMWKNVKNDRFSAKSKTAINGYIYQIAKNKWIDYLRSLRYKNTTFINREIEFDESEKEEKELQNKKSQFVMESITQLNERCQLLLKLFYFERKPFRRIAEIMKIDEAYARTAKYRCQKQLKKLMQNLPNELK